GWRTSAVTPSPPLCPAMSVVTSPPPPNPASRSPAAAHAARQPWTSSPSPASHESGRRTNDRVIRRRPPRQPDRTRDVARSATPNFLTMVRTVRMRDPPPRAASEGRPLLLASIRRRHDPRYGVTYELAHQHGGSGCSGRASAAAHRVAAPRAGN